VTIPFPSLAAILEITGIPDPIERNRRITQGYHLLSAEFHRRIAHSANWCTFAAWASRQAGQTIRNEDLAAAIGRCLEKSPVVSQLARLPFLDHRGVVQAAIDALAIAGPLRRASDAVARGNLKVFAEIAPEFARFLETFPQPAAIDDAALDWFCRDLRPGPPPDGQDLLNAAFRHYREAARASAAKLRSEWMLLGNIRTGFHEQTRLQPEILEALNAAVLQPRDLIDALRESIRRILAGRREEFLLPPPRELIERLAEEIRLATRQVVTGHLMTIELPGEVLRLGRDLRRPFPADLQRLENPALLELMMQIDPTPDSARKTGAPDWAHFPSRMHFITDLFRVWQTEPRLFEQP
jgi:hypothetical protein